MDLKNIMLSEISKIEKDIGWLDLRMEAKTQNKTNKIKTDSEQTHGC